MSGEKRASSATFHILQSEFNNPEYGIRQFRSDVAKLKQLGLVSKHVSARSQEPTRYMVGQVRKFADLIKGEAKAFKIPKVDIPSYKLHGYRVKGQHAIVRAPKGAKVRAVKPVNGVPAFKITVPSPQGGPGVSVVHPLTVGEVGHARLEDFVRHLPPLKKGQYYVFRFNGYMSGQTFSGPNAKKEMLEYFTRYKMPSEDDPEDYLMRFEIVTIEDRDAWRAGYKTQHAESERNIRERNRERYNAWRRKRYAAMDELERREKLAKSKQAKATDKNYHKKKRDELKRTNPEAYRAMLDANAARMKKSRANRKK